MGTLRRFAALHDVILAWRWPEAAAEAGRQVFKAAANEDALRTVNAWGAAEAKGDDFSA